MVPVLLLGPLPDLGQVWTHLTKLYSSTIVSRSSLSSLDFPIDVIIGINAV